MLLKKICKINILNNKNEKYKNLIFIFYKINIKKN